MTNDGPGRRGAVLGRPLLVAGSLLALGFLLAACAGAEQSGPPSAQVTTWVNGAGGAGIGTVKADVANVDYVISKHEGASSIRTVCALLTNDAETAIGNLPTPDTELTDELNTAYTDAAAAGDDCYNGSSGKASLLARSARERAELAPLLAKAVDRIVSVTGRTPTTSTTQPAGDLDPFGG